MNKKEKLVKESLVKAVSSVRKKFRALHNERAGNILKYDDIFKPITGKLDALIDVRGDNRSGQYTETRTLNPVFNIPEHQIDSFMDYSEYTAQTPQYSKKKNDVSRKMSRTKFYRSVGNNSYQKIVRRFPSKKPNINQNTIAKELKDLEAQTSKELETENRSSTPSENSSYTKNFCDS